LNTSETIVQLYNVWYIGWIQSLLIATIQLVLIADHDIDAALEPLHYKCQVVLVLFQNVGSSISALIVVLRVGLENRVDFVIEDKLNLLIRLVIIRHW